MPFLLPYALSGTAIGVVWEFMLRRDGAINALLDAIGLGNLEQAWLLSPPLNTLSPGAGKGRAGWRTWRSCVRVVTTTSITRRKDAIP